MTVAQELAKVGGVTRGAFPWWLIQQPLAKKILIVTHKDEDVWDLNDDLNALFKLPSAWLPAHPFSTCVYATDDEPGRQVSLYHWIFGKKRALVTSLEALNLASDPPSKLRDKSFLLRPGLKISRRAFEERLTLGSYARSERCEQVGEYSIRGDVIDIWPAGEPVPLRLTWNYDELEAIRVIDLHTQRSETYKTELTLFPVLSGQGATVADYVTPETKVFSFLNDLNQASDEKGSPLSQAQLALPGSIEGENLRFQAPQGYSGQIEPLRKQMMEWHDQDWKTAIFCHNEGERDRMEELLEDPLFAAKGLRAPWCPSILIANFEHGFLDPNFRVAVLSNSEIFGRYRKRVRLPKFDVGQGLASPFDIHTHDFLVHEKHGIGRYLGLKPIKVGKVTSEYLTLEYKGGDKLYVPIFEIQQVQKYMGAEGRRPALSSLDTAKWERIKSKVKEDVAKLAAELLKRAARRAVRPGYAFPLTTHMEEEFANSFIYELTVDQKKTLEEVEQDMVSTKAMDRLICGDVGYGKTEVAMRAALKAALAGKQVGFLCPTTLLAEQHYRNFSERLADYPVTVALLSRFQSRAEQKEVLSRLNTGGLDIVIGTHRLLSSDMAFKNLGLLIIDEEHRFGVKQKNKLLALRETADVLTLTATPIPRTLAASMGGIKDLSLIETPPQGRLPISTHVGVFDEDLMAKAVQEELDREGQVFYVHNRVKTLLSRKKWLEEILPSIRIGMVHGQMKESELEEAMHDFLHKKIDLLLTTTIIESGLDIPSVNTLVVEEAEEMGLAQLYQLRGRVGRSSRRAFCYLFYSSIGLTTEAKKRLEALKEFTALGSGFRLALRDMEIRGAGNLLGPEQHGNMAAVGLETFSKLLQEEIRKTKGEEVEEDQVGPVLELSLSSYLPEDYLPSESERVQMYKRILNANREELLKVKEELKDRCGDLPEPAQTLFDAAALRLLLKTKGVAEVHQQDEALSIIFKTTFKLSDKSYQILISQKPEVLAFIPGNPPGIRLYIKNEETSLDALGRFLRLLFPDEKK